MKEGQGIMEKVTGETKRIEVPVFNNNRQRGKNDMEKKEFKHIKTNSASQSNWELLSQLDDLLGLILSGNEPTRGVIRYSLSNKDSYRSEKITGVIKVVK